MAQCKECGTELPDRARFCLHCGAVQPEKPEPPSDAPPQPPPPPAPLDFIQPALAGGMFLGILSTLPIVEFGNFVCCMWVVLGGGIAAVLLARQRPAGITYGDGAYAGVLSGLFGAVVGTAVRIPIQIIMTRLFGAQTEQLDKWLQQAGIEGPIKDFMLRIGAGEVSAVTILFTFFSYLLMWSLFAMIGGILTVAILKKRAQEPQRH